MDSKVDFTLYNQIKEKFSVRPGTLGLIILNSENVDELVMQVFLKVDEAKYLSVMHDVWDNDTPHAVLHYWEPELSYAYTCKEFLRDENLTTKKIEFFKLNPSKKINFNSDLVKKDLAQLAALLFGDSEAS